MAVVSIIRLIDRGAAMTIKRILALPNDELTRQSVLNTALHIAEIFGSHIDVAYVKHVPIFYADTAGDEMSVEIASDLMKARVTAWRKQNKKCTLSTKGLTVYMV